jgi:hypothetical protein
LAKSGMPSINELSVRSNSLWLGEHFQRTVICLTWQLQG